MRTACCVSRVLANPALLREDDDWIGWALAEPARRLERRVRRRLEEARAGDEPVVPLQLYVRARARDQFQRAREVASQKAARALTTGETFETVVDHYLDSFDLDRVAPGERRVQHTTHVAGCYSFWPAAEPAVPAARAADPPGDPPAAVAGARRRPHAAERLETPAAVRADRRESAGTLGATLTGLVGVGEAPPGGRAGRERPAPRTPLSGERAPWRSRLLRPASVRTPTEAA